MRARSPIAADRRSYASSTDIYRADALDDVAIVGGDRQGEEKQEERMTDATEICGGNKQKNKNKETKQNKTQE